MITMTPQARAIAAFTLGVLLIPGYLNRLAMAVYLAGGGDLPSGEGSQFVASLLTVVVAGGVLWFAHSAVAADGPGWETSLAQVGRLLAVIGLVIAVVGTIAVLTNNGGGSWGSFSLSF
jgi:hypothetical protein